MDRCESIAQLIERRRSVRRFRDESVEEEVILELLDLALWAPSPHNSQPWRFTLLQRAARDRLAKSMGEALSAALSQTHVPAVEIRRQVGRSYDRIAGAPNCLVCSLVSEGLVISGDKTQDALEFQMAVQSVGAVLQTLFLAAHARGIATCWMAAPMYCQPVVRETLDLPSHFEPQSLVLLGYAASAPRRRGRRPLADVLSVR